MQICRSDGTYSPCMCGAQMVDGGPLDAGRDLGPTPIDMGRDSSVIVLQDMNTSRCGDGLCNSGEDIYTCPSDCSYCGDGYCLTGEFPGCTADCDCSVEGPDSCAADAACVPVTRLDDFSLRGACTPHGSGGEGAACADLTDCREGLGCFADGAGTTTCRERCDPLWRQSGSGACASATESCFTEDADWLTGSCGTGCTVGTATGCTAGEWCSPSIISDAGVCVPEGTTPELGACTTSDDCVRGTYCSEHGVCDRLCDASTGSGCDATHRCLPFYLRDPVTESSFPSSVGACVEACDFDAGGSCIRGTCVVGGIVGSTSDVCLAVPDLPGGSACSFPDAMEQSLCNGLGACYDVGSGLTCYDLCRASEGSFGGAHPDCGTGQICNGTAGDPLGVCV